MIKKRSKNFVVRSVKYLAFGGIFLQALLVTGCFLFPSYQDYVNSTIKPKQIQGIVIGKGEVKTGCYGFIIFKQSQEIDTLHRLYSCTPPENSIWSYVKPGDSLLKEAGSLEAYIKRDSTSKKFIFPTRIPL
jgi:hypothetical protein